MQNPKYGDKAKICYVDKDSFIVNAKSEDVYDDFAEKVEQRFNILNYEVEGPLSIGKNIKCNQVDEGLI